jgi:curved DNA-binding protein CbpA
VTDHHSRGPRERPTIEPDHYETLGVDPAASETQIATAFRAKARAHHPDVAGAGGTAEMIRINRAWDVLRTPQRRAAYDARRRAAQPTPTKPPRPGDGPVDPAIFWREPATDGTGGAGPPSGPKSGTVLPFGRFIGWSLGQIARIDPGYLEWLEERRDGAPYLAEIDDILRRMGRRRGAPADPRIAARGRYSFRT